MDLLFESGLPGTSIAADVMPSVSPILELKEVAIESLRKEVLGDVQVVETLVNEVDRETKLSLDRFVPSEPGTEVEVSGGEVGPARLGYTCSSGLEVGCK